MPLHVPVSSQAIAELSAEEVWAYVTRLLTSLQDPTHLQKYLGGPEGDLGTVLPAGKSLYDFLVAIPTTPELEAAALTRYTALAAALAAIPTNPALSTVLNIMEHEIEFPTAEALDDISLTGEQTTTERTTTVALPSGAGIRRVLLISVITIMNDTANAQKIDVTVQGRKAAGGWNSYFSQDDVIGFGAVDGATINLIGISNISTLVDEDETYGFRLSVNQSGAFSVRYTVQHIVVVTYRMS